MNALNSIILEGNAKPLTHSTSVNGVFKCTFPVDSERNYRDSAGELHTEVSTFDIECWGNIAENAEKFVKDGRGVRIVGRLKQNKWTVDGKEYSKVVVLAENLEFKPAK